MSSEPILLIKDACIFFDLFDLKMMDAFYKLEVTPVTTVFVIGEVLDEAQMAVVQQLIVAGKLKVYNDGDLTAITTMTHALPALSFADCSVLELAERMPALILSADGSLRNEAKRRNLVVKGLLWVINQLFEKGIMSKDECLVKLERYPQVNSRAPKRDIELLRSKLNSDKR